MQLILREVLTRVNDFQVATLLLGFISMIVSASFAIYLNDRKERKEWQKEICDAIRAKVDIAACKENHMAIDKLNDARIRLLEEKIHHCEKEG